ncbi:hypothetical protein EG833_03350 [archaeon]|nr:hypothetical protein [archaeon]
MILEADFEMPSPPDLGREKRSGDPSQGREEDKGGRSAARSDQDEIDDAREKGRLPTESVGESGLTELALQEAGQHFRAYEPGKSQAPALLA